MKRSRENVDVASQRFPPTIWNRWCQRGTVHGHERLARASIELLPPVVLSRLVKRDSTAVREIQTESKVYDK